MKDTNKIVLAAVDIMAWLLCSEILNKTLGIQLSVFQQEQANVYKKSKKFSWSPLYGPSAYHQCGSELYLGEGVEQTIWTLGLSVLFSWFML